MISKMCDPPSHSMGLQKRDEEDKSKLYTAIYVTLQSEVTVVHQWEEKAHVSSNIYTSLRYLTLLVYLQERQ